MMLGSQPERWQRYRFVPDTPPGEFPKRWHAWRRLCQLVPELDALHVVRHYNEKPPPRPMSDAAFVALAACFANPTKRNILRTLILDLLGDDLVQLIQASKTMGE